jgi:hypothetical protein
MPRVGRKKAEATLLRLLACGATVESAARSAGVAERTVYRRLADASFRHQVQQVQAEMLKRAAAMATAASAESVKTLLELQGAGNPSQVRLGAARAMVDACLKLRLHADVDLRLAALESAESQGGSHALGKRSNPSAATGESAGGTTAA